MVSIAAVNPELATNMPATTDLLNGTHSSSVTQAAHRDRDRGETEMEETEKRQRRDRGETEERQRTERRD